MKTIYKYELISQGGTHNCEPVMIPNGAKFLHVGAQGNGIFLWAEVDPEHSALEYDFEIFGTGHVIYEGSGVERKHLGSLMMGDGSLVFHVYHRTN